MRRFSINARGSAMMLTMIIIVGLLLLSMGALVFASNYNAGASAMRRRQQLANCALSVRQYVASQLRFPSSPALQTLNFTIPGSSGNIVLQGGHYNQPLPSVTGFQLTGSSNGGIATSIEELGNNVRSSSGGGNMTGSATCTDADGKQYEVEFSFAFGPS